jgi:hypothetical protein
MALRRSHRVGPPPGKKVPRHRFPPPGEFIIYSSPVFVVTRGENQEVMTFAATMRVRAGTTTKTAAGSRVVDIEMLEWEAVGKSNLLAGEVRYSLLRGLKSRVAGLTAVADLPGRMELTGRFALLLNGNKVDEHRGRAVGLVSAFPPAEGDLFDISSSEVKLGDVTIRGVVCGCATTREP